MFLDMTLAQFLDAFFKIGQTLGYPVEMSRNGRQIVFPNKKLHEGYLRDMYPEILQSGADMNALLKHFVPGRPCAYPPTRKIIAEMVRG